MQTWADRFPDLYAPGHWPWGELDVQFGTEQPPDELIAYLDAMDDNHGVMANLVRLAQAMRLV